MVNTSAVQDTHVVVPEYEATFEGRLSEILSTYSGNESELIPILQKVQQEFGYVPEFAIKEIAEFLRLPEVTVFGVTTFYAQFKLIPTGRNIVRVCRGTACHVRGGARILREVEKQLGIKPGESTPDLEYSLETVACIGACALAPTMVVNNDTCGQMTTKKVSEILNRGDQGE
ncbi:MAG: NADH-quinone oxidoreductase subunit NuoE [Dehalococcoidia bacterium]|nr:NADH-quinone oxidoreductase subunit NuoE [Dehalococcoidia bacterium]